MGCTHDCSNCSESCSDRKENYDFSVAAHKLSTIDKVIGVVSGKGGVGKSLVTSLLASALQRRGNQCAVLDADITGPSIPKMFGATECASANGEGILPVVSRGGVQLMSINLVMEDPTAPVVWRGPAIAEVVKQFWKDVIWSAVDYMFVDMPPGTGDVPLTVFQSLPVDGIIIVSSPQDLVSMIVEKAVRMAELMKIPVLGIVENMSYIQCPKCGEKISVFGESKVEETAAKHGFELLGQIPIDPNIAKLCDNGEVEQIEADWLKRAIEVVENLQK